ncbi:MAG: hypothetical protein GX415_04370 [Chloroflexi bacterium]|mgnify:CR=1 FL=1|nr:hypothetical protein [Anaerolineaceae bacterium]NLI44632.1 hypothetical protein [Chloroflexota bacterium]HOE35087.1 hypothetical protein [Anaerolineaceae bacterium]HOT25703.1 hypothetical protein [Anaerolineaceae bacterium]HQH57883.1 hypothetical protein [Anaerolineaceae bacterium]
MDDNTNPTPQETPEDAAKSFGDEWQQIPSASAEEWSKEVPPAPIPPEPPTETDRWGAAQPSAADDAGRWSGELYTPGAETAAEVPPAKPAESVVVDVPTTGPTVRAPETDKKKFPVWAIVLIVLLVLLLCCVCPIAIFLGFFSTAWQNSALLLLVM